MTLEDVPNRGAPVHQTITADTVETVTLDADYPAVEVAVKSGTVTFTTTADDPSASEGHYVPAGGALAVRVRQPGDTEVKVFAITADAEVVVTGLS